MHADPYKLLQRLCDMLRLCISHKKVLGTTTKMTKEGTTPLPGQCFSTGSLFPRRLIPGGTKYEGMIEVVG